MGHLIVELDEYQNEKKWQKMNVANMVYFSIFYNNLLYLVRMFNQKNIRCIEFNDEVLKSNQIGFQYFFFGLKK